MKLNHLPSTPMTDDEMEFQCLYVSSTIRRLTSVEATRYIELSNKLYPKKEPNQSTDQTP